MDIVLAVLKYFAFGVLGLIGLLITWALIGGKRVITEWEYETEFRTKTGREFGEFEIESSRIDKEEPDFSFKAKFWMRHKALARLSKVKVFLDELLVLEGVVKTEGRIHLTKAQIQNEVGHPVAGQVCRVLCDDAELVAGPIVPD